MPVRKEYAILPPMRRVLSQKYFATNDTVTLARSLIGKFLVRKIGKKECVFMITEVEAYDGHDDKASHAHKGKTARNEIMFGRAGYWYIYFTYGMHWLLNIVTGEKEYPAAILLRGVEGVSGPARLTKKLSIDKKLHGTRASKASGLWIEDRGVVVPPQQINATPRVGVDYAGSWKHKKYRFVLVPLLTIKKAK